MLWQSGENCKLITVVECEWEIFGARLFKKCVMSFRIDIMHYHPSLWPVGGEHVKMGKGKVRDSEQLLY